MRKKPEWMSCGGLVICTKCGSDEMEMMDVRVRSDVYKRETQCLGCGDRQTTKMEPPELPAAAPSPAPLAEERTWVLDVPADLARCPECEKETMEALNRTTSKGSWRWHLRCTACGVARIELTDRTSAEESQKPRRKAAPTDPRTPAESHHASAAIELLDLGAIHPESVQPRAQMDLLAAGDYARDMFVGPLGQVVNEQGLDWPALVVFREMAQGKVWLADGFHRSKAATQAGMPAMQAEVRAGGKREALLWAVSANSRNGVRFANIDKRRAVTLLFEDVVLGKKSDTEIAALCCVSQPFVSKMRAERRERDEVPEAAPREDREPSNNGYREESEPAPLQFDIVESIEATRRRLVEEEEAAADRRAEAEQKRIEQEQRDSWSTPPDFMDRIVRPILEWIDLDPASNEAAQEVVQAERWISAAEDGLAQEWAGRVWLNPPYSHPLVERFALKAIEEYESGRIEELLVLTNSATGAAWWQALACAGSVLAFPSGRIEFWSPAGLTSDGNRNSQTLFYFARPLKARAAVTHLRSAGYFATMHTTRLDF